MDLPDQEIAICRGFDHQRSVEEEEELSIEDLGGGVQMGEIERMEMEFVERGELINHRREIALGSWDETPKER
jgi:hypothetical protein